MAGGEEGDWEEDAKITSVMTVGKLGDTYESVSEKLDDKVTEVTFIIEIYKKDEVDNNNVDDDGR